MTNKRDLELVISLCLGFKTLELFRKSVYLPGNFED